METKTAEFEIQAKVSSAWTKLQPASEKPKTEVIKREVFDGSVQ